MKKIITLFLAFIGLCQAANALIVNVNGYGEVSEEGLNITISEAELDFGTGKPMMQLIGTLETTEELTVNITRSSTGIEDEFCCAGFCTPGNKETEQTLTFTPNGETSWFIHYKPAAYSEETITYSLSDGQDTRVITVNYIYRTEGFDAVTAQPRQRGVYSILGVFLQADEDISNLPDGIYIVNGKKIVKSIH